jgi:tyrosyl-tRNA synthetase
MSSPLWELLCSRAVEIHVASHLQRRLEQGEKLRVKLGCDPTAPDLHIGHLVVLDIVRAFQEEGHTAVFIVGDHTAMIGDPSGRSDTRPMLSREQVDENARSYFEQVYKILDPERTEVHGNAEWWSKMEAADVLRLLGKQTLNAVLQRDDFANRFRAGEAVGAHEILYPFSQAYDSVAVRADVEIGGTDQLFNLLFGREIQGAYGQSPQDVAVFPLLEGLDGSRKMSKSLGNYIGVSEDAEQIYGKAMSIPDVLIERYLRLVSGMPESELDQTLRLGPRDAKAALARQLVLRLNGEAAAERAEQDFNRKFRQRRPEDAELPEITVSEGTTVAQALVTAGIEESLSRVRRLAGQGGLSIGGEKVPFDRVVREGDLIKIGKRRFTRVRIG